MNYYEDHGLPLVRLKEQRRELVAALIGRKDPISNVEIAEIAALQQAIAAMEAVVGDLDSQIEFPAATRSASGFGIAKGRVPCLVAREDEHGQLGEVVTGEDVELTAVEHLPKGRETVAVEAGGVADAQNRVHRLGKATLPVPRHG